MCMRIYFLLGACLTGVVMLVTPAGGGIANPPTTVLLVTNGPPTNGANSVQSLHLDSAITGGTFRLKFGVSVTSPIVWSPTDATLLGHVQLALRALPTIGINGVTCT